MSANGVRERRTALLLSQVELAALAGISDETLRKIEQGKRVNPANLRRVLDALDQAERDRGLGPTGRVTVAGGTAADQAAAIDLHAIVENMERELDLIRRLLDRTDDETVSPEA